MFITIGHYVGLNCFSEKMKTAKQVNVIKTEQFNSVKCFLLCK